MSELLTFLGEVVPQQAAHAVRLLLDRAQVDWRRAA